MPQLDGISLLGRGSQSRPRRAAHPQVKGSLPPQLKGRLTSAYSVAVTFLDGREGCQLLFSRLGANGHDVIDRMVFFSADSWGPCATGAPAFNYFGRPLTGLCSGFERLDVTEAAVQLLHEALHVAGMNEYPHDPKGLTPKAISGLVRTSCLR